MIELLQAHCPWARPDQCLLVSEIRGGPFGFLRGGVEEFVCATFFSHWPVFLFTVKAVQEVFFSNLPHTPPPSPQKSQIVHLAL